MDGYDCGPASLPVARTPFEKIRQLEAALSAAQEDISHAVREAKRRDPEYPWQLGTASEAVWALGESLLGTQAANDDLHKALAAAQEERDEARAGYRRLDENWHAVHEGAMTPIREALGLPDGSVPELLEAISQLRRRAVCQE